MNLEAYKCIDVDVFKEILVNKFFHDLNDDDENFTILDLVKKVNTVEIKLQGIDHDIKMLNSQIKFRQYGFRAKADFKLIPKQDFFENETILYLIPQKVYELEDVIKKMPVPYCEKGKTLNLLLGDSFERLKVKSKNILRNSANDNQITHYAKKNIQVALRNCYDARLFLVKIQKTKNRNAIYLVIMANIFMINVLSYLHKMFSSYYKDDNNLKDKQKSALYDIMDFSLIRDPEAEYKQKEETRKENQEIKLPKIQLHVQTNQFLTAVYDSLNFEVEENIRGIEIDQKELEDLISRIVYDKKGNLLKKSTISTCLKPSREDKRVSGSKKIDVSKYFDPKNR